MKILFIFLLILTVSSLSAQQKTTGLPPEKIRLYVDPSTNSEDPDIRMAYGLTVTPPWADGGSIFINLPEHLEYMPGTKGIARHHDKRKNVWKISEDSSEANFSVESLTEPGVFFSINAKTSGDRVLFGMTITNRSDVFLKSIRPLLCFEYKHLKNFPVRLTNNFAHTYVSINGKPVAVKDLPVKTSAAIARMAQVKDCNDEHNWWAEEMGGMIESRLDLAMTVLTSLTDDRKVIVSWTPGKNMLSNSYIPCIHADPCIGDLAKGESRTVKGELIFTRAPLDSIFGKLSGK